MDNPHHSPEPAAAAACPAPLATRRELWAWAGYDWANSAFSTLSITILSYYIVSVVVGEESPAAAEISRWAKRWNMDLPANRCGAIVWSWGISLSMLLAALASPVVGAMADARANKHLWLSVTALGGALAAIGLGVVPTEYPWTILGLFFLSFLLFELSFGFYNAFLPELAPADQMDRVSAWGFALGYVGGGIALAAVLLLLQVGPRWGFSSVACVRMGLVWMGVWWGLFSLPTVLILRDRSPPRGNHGLGSLATGALREVFRTLASVRRYRALAWFLVGYLLYNDGIQTVISQSQVFAQKDLGFQPSEIVLLILVFQFICWPGAIVVGRLAEAWGQKPTLMACLLVWIVLLASAYFVTTQGQFWGLALALGVVLGGTQSVARSLMAVMTPPARTAEYFGFFNFSGKATSWIGSFLFGLVIGQTNSARLAIVSLLVLFVAGTLVTILVNVREGERQARGPEDDHRAA